MIYQRLFVVILVLISLDLGLVDCEKCGLNPAVRRVLRLMKASHVERIVNCVVEKGPCDTLSTAVKDISPNVICTPGCGQRHCTCDELMLRIVTRRIKTKHAEHWEKARKWIMPRCSSLD